MSDDPSMEEFTMNVIDLEAHRDQNRDNNRHWVPFRGAHRAEKSAIIAPCQTKLLIQIAHSRVSGRRSLPEMHRR